MLTIPLSLLIIHTIGDFLLQSNKMATGKSKSFLILGSHCLVYSLCFIYFGWEFVGITFVTHFLTDAITSRMTSKLWFIDLSARTSTNNMNYKWPFFARMDPSKRHWFFVVIGFDQLIHFITLGFTYRYLYGG